MRHFYSLLFQLALPFVCLRLLWRSIKAPAYRQRWLERFGCYGFRPQPGVIWFHAVSVGEAEAVFPLIKKQLAQSPHQPVLVTTTTPTGSARVQAVLGDIVQHVYLPYDVPFIADRFFTAFKPLLAVVMETELWPNLFAACGSREIPLYVINARLSEKSMRGYLNLAPLVKPMLANVSLIAAQSQEDAERFVYIGAKPDQMRVCGNIKFDLENPEQAITEGKKLKSIIFYNRPVWIAASTHTGEEEIILGIFKKIKVENPGLLLVIVPRHPERFDAVAALCVNEGLNLVRRTSGLSCDQETDVYLGDTMGELKTLYAAADVALIGGSLLPIGGHNLLEASAVGVPVLFGSYMFNFKEIAANVLAQDAAVQCEDADAIAMTVHDILNNPGVADNLRDNGLKFIRDNRGATDRLLMILNDGLKIQG